MITAALGSVRALRASGRRITESGPWGLRFPPMAVLGFHALLHGEGWLIQEKIEPLRVRPGDVIFTAAGVVHGLSHAPCALEDLPDFTVEEPAPSGAADFEFLCGAYRLEDGRVPALLRQLPGLVLITPDYAEQPELRALIAMLQADFDRPEPGTDAARAALIDLLVVQMLRQMPDRPEVTDPGIAGALHAIHDRPERPWTVEQLSSVAGMSRTTFHRRFTAVTGTPPMTYLVDRRMSLGAQLLRQSPAPLAAIARQVGYSTEFAFSAAFRRAYGMAPGRFRAS
ncbi:AraC family transcriptional regulator [Actinoplanes sp. TRM 88003]|uniref:AraC family transcriptional regulator n=1 Tax=Paractinoplanes aksuensis TaxID=2939490 RepID=A0ABT1E2W6_9ACTN|nr:AraC family transcriptional regulator [Actinoplanes aksuensis]MCO8276161.1 AraC family transcriptional regulator [Actinoplanes aksuensis]